MKFIIRTSSILLIYSALWISLLCLFSCQDNSTTTSGEWVQKTKLTGLPRGKGSGFEINNKMYVVGGYNSSRDTVLNDFWEYDPVGDSWERKRDFPGTGRKSGVAFSLDGKGYYGSGYDGKKALSDFWQYDPVSDMWDRVADLPGNGRYGSFSFTASGRCFVGGGYDTDVLADLWEYNPTGNVWVARTPIGKINTTMSQVNSTGRVNAFAFTVGSYVYVGGGSIPSSASPNYLVTFYRYDVEHDTWLELSPLNGNARPRARELASTFVLNGRGYITCGSIGSTLGDAWQYIAEKDQWVQLNSLNSSTTGASSRSSAIGFSIDNKGYIVSGNSGNLNFNDCWMLDPTIDHP